MGREEAPMRRDLGTDGVAESLLELTDMEEVEEEVDKVPGKEMSGLDLLRHGGFRDGRDHYKKNAD
jgi:hypothetical protein